MTTVWLSALVRSARTLVVLAGLVGLIGIAWFAAGGGALIDRWLVVSGQPTPARAIVCLGGGLGVHNLPTQEGWSRIYTAVQLHADGFAPLVIFSGGGTGSMSEAEVYADAAVWLGLPRDAVVLDAGPGSTAEHPGSLLRLATPALSVDTPLIVVTSPLHSRRTALCFRKAGFVATVVVSGHEAGKARAGNRGRGDRRSVLENYEPSGKRYDDPLNRLKWGMNHFLSAIREYAALVSYKFNGHI